MGGKNTSEKVSSGIIVCCSDACLLIEFQVQSQGIYVLVEHVWVVSVNHPSWPVSSLKCLFCVAHLIVSHGHVLGSFFDPLWRKTATSPPLSAMTLWTMPYLSVSRGLFNVDSVAGCWAVIRMWLCCPFLNLHNLLELWAFSHLSVSLKWLKNTNDSDQTTWLPDKTS